jgi:mono/diheme cytochrome c family protein
MSIDAIGFSGRSVRARSALGARAAPVVFGGLVSLLVGVAGCGSSSSTREPDPTPPGVVLEWGDPSLQNLNWGPEANLTLFFPGYTNWQWLSGVPGYPHPSRAREAAQASHAGAGGVNAGTSCATCHTPAILETYGNRIVDLVDGPYSKMGSVRVTARAAYDASNFYLRLQHQSQRTGSPSLTHQTFRFNGTAWGVQGTPRDFEAGRISDTQLPANGRFDYEDRVAVMLNPTGNAIPAAPGHPGGFNEFGCFLACHSSQRNMPEAPVLADVQAHPYLGTGTAGLRADDIRHYLLESRTAYDGIDGNWSDIAAGYSQAGQRAAGRFIDLWQARIARSAPVGHATNDYVMEYRHSGVGGVDPFFDSRPDNNLAAA